MDRPLSPGSPETLLARERRAPRQTRVRAMTRYGIQYRIVRIQFGRARGGCRDNNTYGTSCRRNTAINSYNLINQTRAACRSVKVASKHVRAGTGRPRRRSTARSELIEYRDAAAVCIRGGGGGGGWIASYPSRSPSVREVTPVVVKTFFLRTCLFANYFRQKLVENRGITVRRARTKRRHRCAARRRLRPDTALG